jgi:hypothetical protein
MPLLIWSIALIVSLGSFVLYGLLVVSIVHSDPKAGYLCLLGIAVCLKVLYEYLRYMAARPYTLRCA